MQNRELREVQSRMEQTVRRMESLFQNAPCGYVVISEAGIIRDLNRTFLDLTGFRAEILLGKPFFALVAPDFRREFLQMLARVDRKRQPETVQLEIIRKESVAMRVVMSMGSFPQEQQLLLTITDISKQYRTSKDLEAQERLFRGLVEHSQSAIYQLNTSGTILYASPSCHELLGAKTDELGNLDFRPFVHPDDLGYCLNMFERAVETKRAQQPYEYRVVRKDGEIRHVRTVLVPLLTASGSVDAFVGNTVDITELHKAREEAERLSHLARHTQGGVAYLNADLQFVWVNEAFVKMSGYAPEELYGKNPDIQLGPATDLQAIAWHKGAIERGEAFSDELYVHRKNGEAYYVRLEVLPIFNTSGVLTGYLGLHTDITESKTNATQLETLNQQLQAAIVAAEAANKAKSEFVANMSHEVRTPMTAILGMARMLEQSCTEQPQRGYLEILSQNARNLLGLLNDLLDLSKIEAGKLDLDFDAFNLDAFLRDFNQAAELRTKAKGLGYSAELPRDLPVTVYGAELRINQILQNLFGNALKFTQTGELRFFVEIVENEAASHRRKDDRTGQSKQLRLRFNFIDTGPGIPADVQHMIFQRFEQVGVGKNQTFGGTGLGLTISKQLCELMGGRIGFRSPVAEDADPEHPGCHFWFELPFEVSQGQVHQKPVTSNQMLQFSGSVLCAEDTHANRLVLEWLLSSRGVDVTFAHNGSDALKLMQERSFDLVLMDVQMPEMDGLEATSRWRQGVEAQDSAGHLPIVAMTAFAMSDDRARCFAAGMDDYLSKPINESDLDRVLQRYLKPVANSTTVADKSASAPLSAANICTQFDPHQFAQKLPGDDGVLQAVVTSFASDLPMHMETLEHAAKAGDNEAVWQVLHKLKAPLGYLNAHPALALIERAEKLMAQEQSEELAATVKSFIQAAAILLAEMKKYYRL